MSMLAMEDEDDLDPDLLSFTDTLHERVSQLDKTGAMNGIAQVLAAHENFFSKAIAMPPEPMPQNRIGGSVREGWGNSGQGQGTAFLQRVADTKETEDSQSVTGGSVSPGSQKGGVSRLQQVMAEYNYSEETARLFLQRMKKTEGTLRRKEIEEKSKSAEFRLHNNFYHHTARETQPQSSQHLPPQRRPQPPLKPLNGPIPASFATCPSPASSVRSADSHAEILETGVRRRGSRDDPAMPPLPGKSLPAVDLMAAASFLPQSSSTTSAKKKATQRL